MDNCTGSNRSAIYPRMNTFLSVLSTKLVRLTNRPFISRLLKEGFGNCCSLLPQIEDRNVAITS